MGWYLFWWGLEMQEINKYYNQIHGPTQCQYLSTCFVGAHFLGGGANHFSRWFRLTHYLGQLLNAGKLTYFIEPLGINALLMKL